MAYKFDITAAYCIMLENERRQLEKSGTKTDVGQNKLKTINRKIRQAMSSYLTFGIFFKKPRYSDYVPDPKYQSNFGRYTILAQLILEQGRNSDKKIFKTQYDSIYSAFADSYPQGTNPDNIRQEFNQGFYHFLQDKRSSIPFTKTQVDTIKRRVGSKFYLSVLPLEDRPIYQVGNLLLTQSEKFQPDTFILEMYRLYEDFKSTQPETKEPLEITQAFSDKLFSMMKNENGPFTKAQRKKMQKILISDEFIYLRSLFVSDNSWSLNYIPTDPAEFSQFKPNEKYSTDQDQMNAFGIALQLLESTVGRAILEKSEKNRKFSRKMKNHNYGVADDIEAKMIPGVHAATDKIVDINSSKKALKDDSKSKPAAKSDAAKPASKSNPIQKNAMTNQELVLRVACDFIEKAVNDESKEYNIETLNELNVRVSQAERAASQLIKSLSPSNPARENIINSLRNARRNVNFYENRLMVNAPENRNGGPKNG